MKHNKQSVTCVVQCVLCCLPAAGTKPVVPWASLFWVLGRSANYSITRFDRNHKIKRRLVLFCSTIATTWTIPTQWVNNSSLPVIFSTEQCKGIWFESSSTIWLKCKFVRPRYKVAHSESYRPSRPIQCTAATRSLPPLHLQHQIYTYHGCSLSESTNF